MTFFSRGFAPQNIFTLSQNELESVKAFQKTIKIKPDSRKHESLADGHLAAGNKEVIKQYEEAKRGQAREYSHPNK